MDRNTLIRDEVNEWKGIVKSPPLQYVKILLDDVCYRGQLYGKRVLENSCGDGNILEEIIVRYIESAKREKRSSDEIRNQQSSERYLCI